MTMTNGKQQTLCVYSVVERGGMVNDMLKIGLALPHHDGRGFDVMLEALPLDNRLVLRENADGEKPGDEQLSLTSQVEAFERAVIEQCLFEAGGKVSPVLE